MPVLEPLADAIAAQPLTDMTFLMTEFGKPFTEKGLGNKVRDWLDAADLKHCSSHGIRKADATIAAENGATGHQHGHAGVDIPEAGGEIHPQGAAQEHGKCRRGASYHPETVLGERHDSGTKVFHPFRGGNKCDENG